MVACRSLSRPRNIQDQMRIKRQRSSTRSLPRRATRPPARSLSGTTARHGKTLTEDANRELDIMGRAVKEIIENSTTAFINDDVELAQTIEPLEQVIDNLKAELRAKHSKRMNDGECTIENGILFFDIINAFERIADHCSNLAVCIIELSQGSYQTHSYLKGVKNSGNTGFMKSFEEYLNKYAIR